MLERIVDRTPVWVAVLLVIQSIAIPSVILTVTVSKVGADLDPQPPDELLPTDPKVAEITVTPEQLERIAILLHKFTIKDLQLALSIKIEGLREELETERRYR